jgi:hypothetical protein
MLRVGCAGKREAAMVSLTEALAAEREKLQQDSADKHARREAGKEVLEALFERLAGKPLLGWSFVLGKDEIVVSHTKLGAIGSWIVDPDLRLKFSDETTEWITIESVGRVLDEAVCISARRMVDTEEQLKAGTNVRRFPEKTV